MTNQPLAHSSRDSSAETGSPEPLMSGLYRLFIDRGHGTLSSMFLHDLSPSKTHLPRPLYIATGVHLAKERQRIVETTSENPSLMHIHGGTTCLKHVLTLNQEAGMPNVLSPLGGLSYSPVEHRGWFAKMRKRWQDRAARRATVIAAYNESEARHLRQIKVHPRIEVLPLGIDTQDYAEVVALRKSLSPKRGERTILYLGPIHPREGLVAFLKAFAELGADADGWNVMLAGRATAQWRGKIEAAIQRKGGADRVTFHESPDFAAQLSLLAQADILVSPALQHRCPTSIMQALACGVPVVATEPVAPDGVGDALVVCRPSRDELRESLRTVMTMTEPDRRAMGGRGLAWIKAHGDWSVLTDQYMALYQSVV